MTTSLGSFEVRAEPEDVATFRKATRLSTEGAVLPLTYPMRWLVSPEIRAALIAMVPEPDLVLVHESQTFDYSAPLLTSENYRLTLAARRETTPDRLIVDGTIAGARRYAESDCGDDPASVFHLCGCCGMTEAIRQGEPVSTRRYGPFGAEDIAAYAAASGDDNPLHVDPAIAARAGLAGVPIHGMLIMGCFESFLRDWRPNVAVRKLSGKFIRPVLIDEAFEVRRQGGARRCRRRRPAAHGEARGAIVGPRLYGGGVRRNRPGLVRPAPRSILITGASSGIGRALALAYAAPGRAHRRGGSR